jgi:hypothetical protein
LDPRRGRACRHRLPGYRTRQTLPDPDGKTARDLEWRLSVVMDTFGPVPVDRVDEALAEDLVTELRTERLAIEHAREQGEPLMETYPTPEPGARISSGVAG